MRALSLQSSISGPHPWDTPNHGIPVVPPMVTIRTLPDIVKYPKGQSHSWLRTTRLRRCSGATPATFCVPHLDLLSRNTTQAVQSSAEETETQRWQGIASPSKSVAGTVRLGLEPTSGSKVQGQRTVQDSGPIPPVPIPDRACTVRGRSRRWPQNAAMRLRSDWTTPVSRKRGNPSKART